MAKRKMTAKYRSKADARRDMRRRKAKKKKGAPAEMEQMETTFLSTRGERLVFWILMVSLIFAMLTHISLLFHEVVLVPRQYKEGGWAKYGERIERMAHFCGLLALAFAIVLVIMRWLPRALNWRAHDFEWMRQLGGYGRKWARIPPAGRFNPEQKIATLAVIFFGTLYVISGVVQEMPALVGENVTLVRMSYSLHAFCLVALGFVALMHVYLCAFARPGGMGAIWSGKVPRKFVETHYSVWHEQSHDASKLKDEEDRRRHEKFVEMEKKRIAKVMAKRKSKIKKGKSEEAEVIEMEIVTEPSDEAVEAEAEVAEIEVESEEGEYEEGEYEEGEYEEGEYEEGEYEEGEYEEGEYDEEAYEEAVQDSEAFDLEPVEGEEEEEGE